jgi:hypothetical protein
LGAPKPGATIRTALGVGVARRLVRYGMWRQAQSACATRTLMMIAYAAPNERRTS